MCLVRRSRRSAARVAAPDGGTSPGSATAALPGAPPPAEGVDGDARRLRLRGRLPPSIRLATAPAHRSYRPTPAAPGRYSGPRCTVRSPRPNGLPPARGSPGPARRKAGRPARRSAPRPRRRLSTSPTPTAPAGPCADDLVMDVGGAPRGQLLAQLAMEEQGTAGLHRPAMLGPTRLPGAGGDADVEIAVVGIRAAVAEDVLVEHIGLLRPGFWRQQQGRGRREERGGRLHAGDAAGGLAHGGGRQKRLVLDDVDADLRPQRQFPVFKRPARRHGGASHHPVSLPQPLLRRHEHPAPWQGDYMRHGDELSWCHAHQAVLTPRGRQPMGAVVRTRPALQQRVQLAHAGMHHLRGQVLPPLAIDRDQQSSPSRRRARA